MEQSQTTILTDHAMLVVWGQFAHCLGLIQAIVQTPSDTLSGLIHHSDHG